MLNENTRKVLKSLTSVGNSAIVRYPITTIAQKDRSLVAFVDIEAIGESEFEGFGVNYLSDLLNLIEFYDDAVITNDNGVINIKTGTSHQRYRTTELDMMKAFDVPHTLLEKISAETPTIKFDITREQLDRFKKIASLVKSDFFVIGHESITVCKLDAQNTKLDESTTDFATSSEATADEVAIAMANIDKLPSGNYEVSLTKNANSGNYISVWTSNDFPISIVVSCAKVL